MEKKKAVNLLNKLGNGARNNEKENKEMSI